MDNPLRDADIPVSGLQAALTAARRGITSRADICALIVQIVDGDCWQKRVILRTGETAGPFATFEQFVTTPPMAGLGTDMALIRSIVQDDAAALDALDRVTQGMPGRPPKNQENKTLYNIQGLSEAPTGTRRAAGLRRLRKDRPDLHARVIAGETTVNAAMIEAGFRKKPISISRDLEGAARTLAREFTHEELQRLVALLMNQRDEE